jgi:hypothetical protein
MGRRNAAIKFIEARGKTVKSIEYVENADWQALVIEFGDGKVFSLEFGSRIVVQASYLVKREGNLKLIRNYGRISGDGRRSS